MQDQTTLPAPSMQSLRVGYSALVLGASGAIGQAFVTLLQSDPRCASVTALSRSSQPGFDFGDPASLERLALELAGQGPFQLVIDATGALTLNGRSPEKRLDELDAQALLDAMSVNAIGPALLLRHLSPLLDRQRAVLAMLSAKVGSIGDNRLGGWYAYRASKAALNQLVRTASVELRRSRPQAICVALHPGTVDTGLSAPFAKSGLQVQAPALAAQRLLTVLAGLKAEDSGEFFDYRGERLPW